MPEPVLAIPEYNDIRQLRTKLFDKISNRASVLTKTLNKIDDISDLERARHLTNEIAFNEAVAFMQQVGIRETILYAFIEAAYQTKEYNFDLYIDRLTSAILANWQDMVTLSTDYDYLTTTFYIDATVLGGIQEWQDAVEYARSKLRIGKNEDIDMASHMWMEKIYRPGREGGTVKRKRVRKNKEGKKEEYEEDITERYIHKYRETIEARLSFVPTTQAPFWELIEYGNTNVDMGRGGIPYPSFGPTHVVRDLEKTLDQLFDSAFTEYRIRADKYLSKLLSQEISNTAELMNYSINDVRGMSNYLESKSYDGIMGTAPLMEVTSNIVEDTAKAIDEVVSTAKGKKTRLKNIKPKRLL